MTIQVVYEDQDIIIINKPSGLITHPKDSTDTQYSVTQWLTERNPETKSVGEDPLRPGLVHRLDKDTSGLLLLTKNQDAFLYYKSLFQGRTIKKSYLALVSGRPNPPAGIIDAPMGRIGMKRTTQLRGKKKLKDQKDAVTEYETKKEYDGYTLVEARPQTGRTHQIRVHLQSIGTPISGDPIYGLKRTPPSGLNRLFLHAYRLVFSTRNNQSMTIECDLPPDLQSVLDTLDKN